jgi:hypothetical protein
MNNWQREFLSSFSLPSDYYGMKKKYCVYSLYNTRLCEQKKYTIRIKIFIFIYIHIEIYLKNNFFLLYMYHVLYRLRLFLWEKLYPFTLTIFFHIHCHLVFRDIRQKEKKVEPTKKVNRHACMYIVLVSTASKVHSKVNRMIMHYQKSGRRVNEADCLQMRLKT